MAEEGSLAEQKTSISRRDFLKLGGLSALSLAIPTNPEGSPQKERHLSRLEEIGENVRRYKSSKLSLEKNLSELGFSAPLFMREYPQGWNELEADAEDLLKDYKQARKLGMDERDFIDSLPEDKKSLVDKLFLAWVPEARAKAIENLNARKKDTGINYEFIDSTPSAIETWGQAPEAPTEDSEYLKPYGRYAVQVVETLINRRALSDIGNPSAFPIRKIYISGAKTDVGGEISNGEIYIYYSSGNFDATIENNRNWYAWNVILHEAFHGMFPGEGSPWMGILTPTEILSVYESATRTIARNKDFIDKEYAWISNSGLYEDLSATYGLHYGIGSSIARRLLVDNQWDSGDKELDEAIRRKIFELGGWSKDRHPDFSQYRNEMFMDVLLNEQGLRELGKWVLDNYWKEESFRKALNWWSQEEIFHNHFHYGEIISYIMTNAVFKRGGGIPGDFIEMTNYFLALGRNDPPLTVVSLHDRLVHLYRQSGLPSPVEKKGEEKGKYRGIVVPEPRQISNIQKVREMLI